MQPITSFESQESARLLMRKPDEGDVDALFKIFGDPRTNTFNPDGPYKERSEAEISIGRWLTHWERCGFGPWTVSLQTAPLEIIGFGGISYAMYDEQERINLGYRFSTQVWGKGIASEFAEASILSCFRLLRFPEIFARVSANNVASRRVLEKAGLRQIEVFFDPHGVPTSMVYGIKRPTLEIYA